VEDSSVLASDTIYLMFLCDVLYEPNIQGEASVWFVVYLTMLL